VEYPWGIGTATGVGSLPYDDRDEAARFVAGELPEFAHVPELPGRGAGADTIGRTAALLVDMPVDLQPAGWRLVDRAGADVRRARSMLDADLDALEIALHGYRGPLKIQMAGPFTLAAAIERNRGDRVLADHGARRDLAYSLAEGVTAHRADIAGRVPGAQVVVQLDEPGLPAVLAGSIPTASGFGRHRAVRESEAEDLLRVALSAAGPSAVVHCCASDPPAALLHRAGAAALSVDISALSGDALDHLREPVDDGLALWPGVVPTLPVQPVPSDGDLAKRLVRFYDRIDADAAKSLPGIVVTPACGLAGADLSWARTAYKLVRDAARAFAELAGAQ
jgi:methionine synthase II (cobalamin-independent)